MLHAVIRNREDALHFLAEVNAYNLKTLEQHAREMAKLCATVVDIELDPADRDYLNGRGQRWIKRLAALDGLSINLSPSI